MELAEVLLMNRADLNAVAKSRADEITPLTFAIKAKHEKMAEFLKSRGGHV